jgi:Carboxypeptidase regulatory-like domain
MKAGIPGLSAALLAVLIPGALIGQVKSDEPVKTVRISGRVQDPKTAPFINMTVVLNVLGRSDTSAWTTKTDHHGLFAFDVPADIYEIHFQAPGFRAFAVTVRAVGSVVDIGTVKLQAAPTYSPTVVAAQGQQKDQGQKTKISNLWAAISIPQPIIFKADTEKIQLYFALFNDGTSTINPKIGESRLFINGVELNDWHFMLSNGLRGAFWNSLPPGHSEIFSPVLGSCFQKPGVYTVRWQGQNFSAPAITFRVLPGNSL